MAYLYVIRLSRGVTEQKKFKTDNPSYTGRKPCVYVGSTLHVPEVRLAQHLNGHKAAKVFKNGYGEERGDHDPAGHLMPRLYASKNPVPAGDKESRERDLAQYLRSKGYGVWQA